MTDEHILPQALGGRLTCRFLCKDCNSSIGAKYEGFAKSDPLIQSSIAEVGATIPSLMKRMTHGQGYIAKGQGGSLRGVIRNREFQVKSDKLEDGSLIQPTPNAERTIRTLLQKKGIDRASIGSALQTFLDGPENCSIQLADDLHVVKWSIESIRPALDGPLMNSVVPLKSAYEFLALHLNASIYEEVPCLIAARRALETGEIDPTHLAIERLYGPSSKPFHGLLLESSKPCTTVQIRFFGKLAYRVYFRTISIDSPRFIYTHDLTTNEEYFTYASN